MLLMCSFGNFRPTIHSVFKIYIQKKKFIFRILIPETKGETLNNHLPHICDETEDMRYIEHVSKVFQLIFFPNEDFFFLLKRDQSWNMVFLIYHRLSDFGEVGVGQQIGTCKKVL